MTKTTELSGLEPVAWALIDDSEFVTTICPGGDEAGFTRLYSAATVERLVQERDTQEVVIEKLCTVEKDLFSAKRQLAAITKWSATEAAVNIPSVLEYVAGMDKQLAAVSLERNELKMSVAFWASHTPTDAYVDDLAASQAREQQLRDAVSYALSHYSIRTRAADFLQQALTLPQDDSALEAWGAKLLREMAAQINDQYGRIDGMSIAIAYLRDKEDELETKA